MPTSLCIHSCWITEVLTVKLSPTSPAFPPSLHCFLYNGQLFSCTFSTKSLNIKNQRLEHLQKCVCWSGGSTHFIVEVGAPMFSVRALWSSGASYWRNVLLQGQWVAATSVLSEGLWRCRKNPVLDEGRTATPGHWVAPARPLSQESERRWGELPGDPTSRAHILTHGGHWNSGEASKTGSSR